MSMHSLSSNSAIEKMLWTLENVSENYKHFANIFSSVLDFFSFTDCKSKKGVHVACYEFKFKLVILSLFVC